MPDRDAGARALADQAISLARVLSDTHAGRVASYDATSLRRLLQELERLEETIALAVVYASLQFDADTEPPEHGALVAEMEEAAAQVETLTNFFDLEWIEVPDPRARQLLIHPELAQFAHALTKLRLTRPHRLSAAEEQILTQKSVTGWDAWQRLLDEQLAAIAVELGGERIELADALARLSDADRADRRRAAEAISASLMPGLRTRISILNTVLADHALDDRLRRYPHWLAAQTLDNEASDKSVQALVDAVVRRYDIPRRWSELKARVLGLGRLADYDRFAPVGAAPARYTWPEARSLVLDSYHAFSAELGAAAERFFAESWIDAALRPGKGADAYCDYTVPAANPFIILNFAGRREDVLTLAHELGHGLHFLLAAPRGILQLEMPVTVAETASVFGETLTFARLLSVEEDPQERFGLIAYQLDEAVATVFRQVALHRFEAAIHADRRENGELSASRVGDHWLSVNAELYGDTVELTPEYRDWWSFTSHVFAMPGYVHAYAYGQLLALSLYARYVEEGEAFVPRYLELLRAGGSRSPEALAAICGIDLSDPDFWDTGLDLIEQQLTQAEHALSALET